MVVHGSLLDRRARSAVAGAGFLERPRPSPTSALRMSPPALAGCGNPSSPSSRGSARASRVEPWFMVVLPCCEKSDRGLARSRHSPSRGTKNAGLRRLRGVAGVRILQRVRLCADAMRRYLARHDFGDCQLKRGGLVGWWRARPRDLDSTIARLPRTVRRLRGGHRAPGGRVSHRARERRGFCSSAQKLIVHATSVASLPGADGRGRKQSDDGEKPSRSRRRRRPAPRGNRARINQKRDRFFDRAISRLAFHWRQQQLEHGRGAGFTLSLSCAAGGGHHPEAES